MKNEYKEVFDLIVPDDELVNSVTKFSSKKKNSYKPLAAAICVLSAFVCVLSVNLVKKTHDNPVKTDVVTVLVAHETGRNVESSKHIEKTLSSGVKKIKIDADVIIEGKAGDMCIYSADDTFFYEEELKKAVFVGEKLYWGEENRAFIGYPTGSGITFNVSEKGGETARFLKGEGYARGCETSYVRAKETADRFILKMGKNNFKFVEGNILDTYTFGKGYSSTGTGFYSFKYLQYVDGFPLETVTSNVYNGVASLLDIFVNDEGVTYLRMCGLDLVKKKELNGKIISVETAIELIEKNLSDLWLSEYAPIVEIRLEYMLDCAENGEMELVPCWHFCIDQTDIKFLSTEEQRRNDTNDLCINAVTGEMFRVADRYPVYQTKDGIISTWNK